MVSGSEANTKEQIVRVLRETDEPAHSAAGIAEKTGYAKRTINNHISDLEDEGRVKSTSIGNARAYYTASEPNTTPPDHTCNRCKRKVNEMYDFTKIELDRYFTNGSSEESSADFYILCRFCYNDLASFLFGDDGSMYDYPFVHRWDIPENQLEEVREDNTVTTHPGMNMQREEFQEIHEVVEDLENANEWVSVSDVYQYYSEDDELDSLESKRDTEELMLQAQQAGLLYYSMMEDKYKTAK